MKTRAAFTLIELVLVMALLVTLAAVAVPSLSRTLRGRNLDQEAERLLALTGYARDEAVSQGIPMIVWVDAAGGRCGVDAKPGFQPAGAENTRAREYGLAEDVRFDPVAQGMVPTTANVVSATGGNAASASTHGGVMVAEFEPDGTLDPSSLAGLRIVNRANDALNLSRTSDADGYEITRDAQP